jgi:3-oxoacyl-[acyl-carrier protein] reductase
MDLGLTGKTALVLGGSRGLGRAIATALAGEGARVAIASRDGAALHAAAEDIRAKGATALPIVWDLSNLNSVDDRVSRIESELGALDILVNNSGGPPPTPAAAQSAATWTAQFQAMVLSILAVTDRVLPGMRQRKWGRIITSTSSGVVAPIPNLAMSNALRMCLVGWSKTLAREVAADGVTANILVPGRILTDRIRELDRTRAEREGKPRAEIERESLAAIPIGRLGDPGEYGAVAAFLASQQAAYITGSVIRVDGGMIASI